MNCDHLHSFSLWKHKDAFLNLYHSIVIAIRFKQETDMALISLVLIYVLLERCNPTTILKMLHDFHNVIMYLYDLYRHIIFLVQNQEGKSYV